MCRNGGAIFWRKEGIKRDIAKATAGTGRRGLPAESLAGIEGSRDTARGIPGIFGKPVA